MGGEVSDFLSGDHRRLESLLESATLDPTNIDDDAYLKFRGGLLRHIAMEEKILLPAAKVARGGEALPQAARLRLDHGALAALLVMTPTPSIVAAMRKILKAHNPLEEGADGVYSQCEQLPDFDSASIMSRLEKSPPVPMAPYSDNTIAKESARAALQRAGYSFEF